MKYPIGIQDFRQIIENGFIYVDKTAFVYDLANRGSIYFLSRPRRFGKSLLVSTLKYYFEGNKELFKGLAIEQLETEWKKHPIFHIDFNGTNFLEAGALEKVLEGYISAWENIYGKEEVALDLGNRFAKLLQKAFEQTGSRAVVLIDEYDKPMLDVLDTGMKTIIDGNERLLEERNREVLKGFYSVFKKANESIRFVLLTGVTKFSQVSIFSGFNQPADISMWDRYETLCGISEQELYTYFHESIEELASALGETTEETKAILKQRYDGYHFSDRMTDIYNPFSLLNVFASSRLDDFWFRSGSPTYLVRLMQHNDFRMDEVVGNYYTPSEFVDYRADVERPLPMFFQSGYLTIKGVDTLMNEYLLDFPNREVANGFVPLLSSNYFGVREEEVTGWLRKSIRKLTAGQVDDFLQAMQAFLSSIEYSANMKEKKHAYESHFHYTFLLILRMMGCYTVLTEKQNSQGRADVIVECKNYVFIFEFKLDGTAEEALQQIEHKGYALPYNTDKRSVYKIGVNFSSKAGTLTDWKIVR